MSINFENKINENVNMFVKIEKSCDKAIKINFLT